MSKTVDSQDTQSSTKTASILDQMAELENAKQARICALIQERLELEDSTEERMEAIRAELKALGWFPPRKAKMAQDAVGAKGAKNG